MSGVILPEDVRRLRADLYDQFKRGQAAVTPWWDKLATRVTSNGQSNTYGWLKDLPRFRKWVGQRIVHSLEGATYTIPNEKYELTIGVDEDRLADQDLANEQIVLAGIGREATDLPNQVIAKLLLGAETSLGYDGQYFVDADHPQGPNNTPVSNLLTGSALTEANFETAYNRFASFVDDNGGSLKIVPNLLVVGTGNTFTAKKLLEAEKNAAGADNVYKGVVDLLVLPELNDEPGSWFLMATNGYVKPFILQERERPVFVSKAELTDDNRFWRGELVFGGKARYGAGYSLWQYVVKGKP